MRVSLIIPAYNEEARLKPFLESIVSYSATHPTTISEIIMVDDGSRDATVAVAKSFAKYLPLRIVQHPHNRGKGAAVKTGVFAAKGDWIIFMDADGATSIHELPKMLRALKHSPIAVGNRWLPGAKTQRSSTLRRLAGWANRSYLSLLGIKGVDTMCGFKGYHATAARDLFHDLEEERWLFDTEIAYRAIRRRYVIENFPISWQSKEGSKLSAGTLLASALHTWPLIQRIKKQEHS